MKKKKYWPKGLPGDKILEALRMEEVGTTQVLVGKFKGEKNMVWLPGRFKTHNINRKYMVDN
jgi:hypothetical protein